MAQPDSCVFGLPIRLQTKVTGTRTTQNLRDNFQTSDKIHIIDY